MILGLLAGNTSFRFCVYEGGHLRGAGRIEWQELDQRGAEVRALAAARGLTGLVAGSVRDDLLERVRPFLPAALWPPRLVRKDFEIPIQSRYERPAEAGTDRLLNALAAASLAAGRPAIVVDFGTAVSLSVVDSRGVFLGGAIAAGGRAVARGLAAAAPRLPEVAPGAPRGFIPRNTLDAVRTGVFWQVAGGVRALIEGIERELLAEGEPRPLVLATGGEAELIAPHVPAIERTVPDLTLRGLGMASGELGARG